jgi:peptidase E
MRGVEAKTKEFVENSAEVFATAEENPNAIHLSREKRSLLHSRVTRLPD